MSDASSSRNGGAPSKAFIVSYNVVNKIEGIIYAESAADARRRFAADDYDQAEFEATGEDWRTGGVTVRRFPSEDH